MINIPSVFIVEDDISLQELYEKALSFHGYDVEIANNGQEAVDKYKSFSTKPDIILMDHRMPIKTGLEATEEIFKMNPQAKIIFASADKSIKAAAIALGVLCFEDKPFTLKHLLKSIEKALKRHIEKITLI